MAHLPMGDEMEIDITLTLNGQEVDEGAGSIITNSELVEINGKRIIPNNNFNQIKEPFTILFKPHDCELLLSDSEFKIFLGDRFSGAKHDFIIPGDVKPSDFSDLSGNYPYTFRELITNQEVNKVIDILYDKQKSISGVDPINIYGKDLMINFDRRVCGVAVPDYSFQLGHGCIEAPQTGDFMWWVLGHEMGHYFTLNSESFKKITGGIGYYVESFASLIACWAFEEIEDNIDSYGLSKDAKDAIYHQAYTYKYVIGPRRERVLYELIQYEKDPDFSKMNVPVFFDIFVRVSNEHGPDITRNFFKIYSTANEDNPLFNNADTTNKRHTFMVASISAAVETDLRGQFKAWNFPIEDSYINEIYTELIKLIGDTI